MDMNCAVIYDLLPLYLEGLCSEETKVLVEVHLADCPNCQETYRRMAAGSLPEPAVPETEKREEHKPLNAKKVFKRLRRRWIALLLCALLAVPVTLLSVNQADGTGLSFTAIPYVVQTRAFLSAVTSGNHDKAFSMVDVAREYESYATSLYADFSEHPLAQYHPAEIGGESYYVSDSVYRNGYVAYQEDGDEVRFWLDLLLFHESMHDPSLMIPEKVMPAIEHEMEKDEGLYQSLGYFLSRFSLFDGDAGRYYVDSDISEGALTGSDTRFSVLPAHYYNLSVQRAKEEIGEMVAFSAGYTALGLEKYTELSQGVFTQNLESLAQKGINITDFRLTDIYVMEDGIYHITYALKLTVNGRAMSGSSIELTIGKNGVISSSFQESSRLTIREDTAPLDLRLIRLYFLEWDG